MFDRQPIGLGLPNTLMACTHLTGSLAELHKPHNVLSRWLDADVEALPHEYAL